MNFPPGCRRFLPPALVALAILAPFVFTLAPPAAHAQRREVPVTPSPMPAASTEPPANHLATERSPYLLQHAHNPVDWYPWGEAAFAKARKENKPIFLSVGYSTCHWCHVMERESFENPTVAKLMNDSFVAIKVDREERPDVDATYMAFVQATTGGGGWPMTVFLTPGLKPFTGGTYFPATDQDGQPGLKTILPEIATAWREHRPEIVSQADQMTAKLREMTTAPSANAATSSASTDTPRKAWLDTGFQQLAARFDPENGGFGRGGGGPKFPQPSTLNFLTRYHARQPADSAEGKRALEMDLLTLRRMAAGGIHDPLGGGFHRYSTDPRWHVPHFEKMLYDQAQLAVAYLEAYQITGETAFADTARDTLDYVRRDLTDPATGGFLSAEDADSQVKADDPERVEGAFYVWTKAEIDHELGAEDAALFEASYGVTEVGNVPPASDARGELKGKNVLDATGHPLETAAAARLTPDAARPRLDAARAKLLAHRDARPRPRRDDKVITAWNGLMISAFARAAQVLGDPVYLAAGQRAAAFLEARLYDAKAGRITRSYRQGPSEAAGFAEDYAFLIQGLLDLYEADFQPDHLRWAEALQKTQDTLFWDETNGGYFDTSVDADPYLPLRAKAEDDGAQPSANSVAALNLARLGQMLESDADQQRGARVVQAFAGSLRRAPLALPQMLVALDFQLGPTRQIVIAGQPGAPDTAALLRAARQPFLPRRVLLLADGAAGQAFLAARAGFFQDLRPLGGGATAYVCQNFACQLPTNEVGVMLKLLRKPAATPNVPRGK